MSFVFLARLLVFLFERFNVYVIIFVFFKRRSFAEYKVFALFKLTDVVFKHRAVLCNDFCKIVRVIRIGRVFHAYENFAVSAVCNSYAFSLFGKISVCKCKTCIAYRKAYSLGCGKSCNRVVAFISDSIGQRVGESDVFG